MKLTESDRNLHQQFTECGRNAKEWLRKCALLLPEIDRRQIWKKCGLGSVYEYAAKVAGMSRHSVEDALRILKKIEDKPLLKKIAERKGLNAVRPVIGIVNSENEEFWAEKATALPKHALEAYVRNFRLEFRTGTATEPVKEDVHFSMSPGLAKKLQQLSKRADFEYLLEKFVESVDAQKETPQAVVTSSRHIPAHIEHFVRERTGGLCAFPGCQKEGSSLHHTQRWALEKIHDPNRLHLVCPAHESLAHNGLIENEDESPEHWKVREYADPMGRKEYIDWLVSLHRHR